jgi:integrase
MARQLTDLAVKAIKPKAKYFEVVDGTTGLRLAVFPSGARSWIARYRRPTGQTAKLTIGRYPAISLSAARIRAAEARAAVAGGTDPGEAKRRAKAEAAQAEAERHADSIELQVKQHLERQSKTLTQPTWLQARLALEGDALRAWHGRMVGEIRKRDVIALVEKIAEKRGPIAGNRAFGHLRRFFNVLVERDVIAASPCTGVRKPSVERSRDRVLNDTEIRSLWRACDAVGGPAAAAIKLLLLTGQRRSEVSHMAWNEIEGDTWTLTKERTKNRKAAHVVPLSRQAQELIEQQPRIGDYVFTSGSKPVANFTRIKEEIDAIMKPDAPFVVHDLRRTVATNLQKLNVPIHVTEAVLNHRSGTVSGITAVYQVHDYADEKRAALAAWGREVERIVTGKSAKIVKLRS